MSPQIKIYLIRIRDVVSGFVVPLVCFVVSVALVLLIIVPSIKMLPGTTHEVNNKKEQVALLKKKVGILEKLIDFKTVVDEDFVLLTAAIPSESQVPQLLTQIDQVARESGLAVVTMNYTLSNALAGEIDVTLTATGNYDQIVNFLSNIEKASRIIELDNLRYGENKDAEGNAALLATFVLKSPYLASSSKAVTVEPLSLDISDAEFLNILSKIKGFKIYKYAIEDLKYKQVTESTRSVGQ